MKRRHISRQAQDAADPRGASITSGQEVRTQAQPGEPSRRAQKPINRRRSQNRMDPCRHGTGIAQRWPRPGAQPLVVPGGAPNQLGVHYPSKARRGKPHHHAFAMVRDPNSVPCWSQEERDLRGAHLERSRGATRWRREALDAGFQLRPTIFRQLVPGDSMIDRSPKRRRDLRPILKVAVKRPVPLLNIVLHVLLVWDQTLAFANEAFRNAPWRARRGRGGWGKTQGRRKA